MLRFLVLLILLFPAMLFAQTRVGFEFSATAHSTPNEIVYINNTPNFGAKIGANVSVPLNSEKLSLVTGAFFSYRYFHIEGESYRHTINHIEAISFRVNQSHSYMNVSAPLKLSYRYRFLEPFAGLHLNYCTGNRHVYYLMNSAGYIRPEETFIKEAEMDIFFIPFTFDLVGGTYISLGANTKLKMQYAYGINNYVQLDVRKEIINGVSAGTETFYLRNHSFELGIVINMFQLDRQNSGSLLRGLFREITQ